jgi:hypothetical protein
MATAHRAALDVIRTRVAHKASPLRRGAGHLAEWIGYARMVEHPGLLSDCGRLFIQSVALNSRYINIARYGFGSQASPAAE